MAALRQLDDNLWDITHPLSMMGLQLGTRMTVLRTGNDLLLHSPVPCEPALLDELRSLGNIRWTVGPNLLHHLFLGEWAEHGAKTWIVPGLETKRKDLRVAGHLDQSPPWESALSPYIFKGFPAVQESVFFHAPSKTLIVSDLLFNLSSQSPWLTKMMMRMVGGYPGPCCTLLEKVLMHRKVARKDFEHILRWDFDRVILAHGEIVETGGKEVLEQAYRWLLD